MRISDWSSDVCSSDLGMRGIPLMRDVRIDGDLQRPEIVIKPSFDVAADLGVTTSALSQTIRIATIGDIEQNLANFSLSDRQVPIRVSIADRQRNDLSVLANRPVPRTDRMGDV